MDHLHSQLRARLGQEGRRQGVQAFDIRVIPDCPGSLASISTISLSYTFMNEQSDLLYNPQRWVFMEVARIEVCGGGRNDKR